MKVRGSYNPDAVQALDTLRGFMAVMPMSDRNDGHANAVYRFAERRESSGKWVYQLDHIDEWLPPVSPREKAERFTDEQRLPPLDESGRIDWRALAARREREWLESEA